MLLLFPKYGETGPLIRVCGGGFSILKAGAITGTTCGPLRRMPKFARGFKTVRGIREQDPRQVDSIPIEVS